MSTQQTDTEGAADFLQITAATVKRRLKAGTFPAPDVIENDVEWWDIETLDKYKKALRRKQLNTRKRAV